MSTNDFDPIRTNIEEYTSARDALFEQIRSIQTTNGDLRQLVMQAIVSNDFEATLMESAQRIDKLKGVDPCSRVIDITDAIRDFRLISQHYRALIDPLANRARVAERAVKTLEEKLRQAEASLKSIPSAEVEPASIADNALEGELESARQRFRVLLAEQHIRRPKYKRGDDVVALDYRSFPPGFPPVMKVHETKIDPNGQHLQLVNDPVTGRWWNAMLFRHPSDAERSLALEMQATVIYADESYGSNNRPTPIELMSEIHADSIARMIASIRDFVKQAVGLKDSDVLEGACQPQSMSIEQRRLLQRYELLMQGMHEFVVRKASSLLPHPFHDEQSMSIGTDETPT